MPPCNGEARVSGRYAIRRGHLRLLSRGTIGLLPGTGHLIIRDCDVFHGVSGCSSMRVRCLHSCPKSSRA
ncbi:hypothetical protein DVU_0178 [Nitratidesulfovibrio vulgaris str. Hildenborough]|uniref:Uncharacterized protein n=1 Tax=Nitratidesulfovibrio vulgaris (strain ATCC 29579 / DSM 644 / CCUG 34227 / NCIMB 8303 / VKM B-1760 / Hildenborough) TaxID=882 RepID=Q72FN5_NITV2|nr:hypothetical protein DVU_0178 [Nitratidesulfovibrio vulgaris str. Hildenborough]